MKLIKLLILSIFLLTFSLSKSQISIPSLPYNPSVTNFDSYNPNDSANALLTIPTGWVLSSSSTPAYNGRGTGTSTTGGYWGYGSSSDFSLGTLRSGGPGNITYSVSYTNNSGSTITSITLSWDYEQWRYANTSGFNCSGTGILSGNTTLDSKDFSGVNTGTNGTSTTTSVTSFTLNGLSIANTQTFGISWITTDVTGADNGVSIDNFSISASTSASCPNVTTDPSNQSIVWGNSTLFSIVASGALSYQWELNTGSGWSSLSNGSVYSGVLTDTLRLSNTTLSMNGYLYRCIVSNGSCLDTSNSATLTVNSRTNTGSGLVINEFSQGNGGSKEYLELVVFGPPCTRVDLRNWIIDDNNGIFSGGDLTGTGVAEGYIRFSNTPLWASVSTGTIILIYNGYDTCSSITTYFDNDPNINPIIIPILPSDSTYFIGNDSTPTPNSPLSAIYSNKRTFPNWAGALGFDGQISLANSGDGYQIRKPDTTFFHGAAYGASTTHPDVITYGTNRLLFSQSGANRNYYLSDTLFGYDFKDNVNWTTDTAYLSRTPGLPNNAKNNAWINYLIGGCPLPIELNKFTATCNGDNTSIYFSTLSQSNVDYFYLQKSTDGINWSEFAWFQGKKYSSQLDEFRATDDSKYKYYYRIKEVDLDGTIIYSNMIYSSCLNTDNNTTDIKIINNNILNIQTNSNEKLILNLYSIDGKLIKSGIIKNSSQIELDALSRGIYITSLISESGQINIVKKILIK